MEQAWLYSRWADPEFLLQAATYLPLLICSIYGSAVFLFKRRQLRRVHPFSQKDLKRLLQAIASANHTAASDITKGPHGDLSPILQQLLASGWRDRSSLKAKLIEEIDLLEAKLERNISSLSTIAGLGPLFGLMGTVVGVIIVFQQIALQENMVSPAALAGGIGTALYTTLIGLVVGILGLLSYRSLIARLERLRQEMEAIGLRVVDQIVNGAQS